MFVKLDMKTPHLVQQDGSAVGKARPANPDKSELFPGLMGGNKEPIPQVVT